jgi:hypothetical protein
MTEEKPAKITVLDAASVEPIYGTPYPEPYDREPAAREKRPLGDAVGLRNFGVNMTRLRLACGRPNVTGTRARTNSSTSCRAR